MSSLEELLAQPSHGRWRCGRSERALNDAACKASVLWTTFVTYELYLAIAFGSVNFVVAPAILVIFHFYVFLQLYGLATKAREYIDLLKEQAQVKSDWQRL